MTLLLTSIIIGSAFLGAVLINLFIYVWSRKFK